MRFDEQARSIQVDRDGIHASPLAQSQHRVQHAPQAHSAAVPKLSLTQRSPLTRHPQHPPHETSSAPNVREEHPGGLGSQTHLGSQTGQHVLLLNVVADAFNSALLLPSPRRPSLTGDAADSPRGATAITPSLSLSSPRVNGVGAGVGAGGTGLRTSMDSALRSASNLFDIKVLQVLQPVKKKFSMVSL